MQTFLEFEKPIAELEGRIRDLKSLDGTSAHDVSVSDEVRALEDKVHKLLRQTYAKLTPWQKVMVARHPSRPHCLDYIDQLIDDFVLLAGDRLYGEDEAVIGGLGRLNGRSVMVIGLEKGNDTASRVKHNFGMAKPEGYRKAQRLMRMADQFGLPIITLVDTAGAYPGIASEERGQAEAIAASIQTCLRVGVPIVSVILGEGGSGGAIAIATADQIIMLEHSVYSVISPEGCASILWRAGDKAQEAAQAMRLTAQDLKEMGVIDTIIDEPVGGAHRDVKSAIAAVGASISAAIDSLSGKDADKLKKQRRDKYLAMGRPAP
ncbi:acetyl-CoA carboxylase carboxyltransferase subunit alpha [Radicibacter daui]|uniref:acetyl-CoA carboxylase carboxyltransferase subunit alpha n=1 Tax=Radicibacter daui TaxID=3064829 RepID=UPI004046AE42